MSPFWEVKTKDGKIIDEFHGETWRDIKNEVAELSLILDCDKDKRLTLPPNMDSYIQGKTASADLNGANIQIESRYIAFKLGNNTVRVRVNEKTQNISVEID